MFVYGFRNCSLTIFGATRLFVHDILQTTKHEKGYQIYNMIQYKHMGVPNLGKLGGYG